MKCLNCGTELVKGARYCGNCGAKLFVGKQKCLILKAIRQRIADECGIPFVTKECDHEGDCPGTCPACEAELRYLEQELERRKISQNDYLLGSIYCSFPDVQELPAEDFLAYDTPGTVVRFWP